MKRCTKHLLNRWYIWYVPQHWLHARLNLSRYLLVILWETSSITACFVERKPYWWTLTHTVTLRAHLLNAPRSLSWRLSLDIGTCGNHVHSRMETSKSDYSRSNFHPVNNENCCINTLPPSFWLRPPWCMFCNTPQRSSSAVLYSNCQKTEPASATLSSLSPYIPLLPWLLRYPKESLTWTFLPRCLSLRTGKRLHDRI